MRSVRLHTPLNTALLAAALAAAGPALADGTHGHTGGIATAPAKAVHAPFDGDVVFALSTQRRPCPEPAAFTLARLGALAADTLARAVARAVYEATPWPGASVRCWRDLPA